MTVKPVFSDDLMVKNELQNASVVVVDHRQLLEGEVQTRYSGQLGNGKFLFVRARGYWVVEGEVPLPAAKELFSSAYGGDIHARSVNRHPYGWIRRGFELGIANDGDSWAAVKPTERGPMVIYYHIDVSESKALGFFVEFLQTHNLV